MYQYRNHYPGQDTRFIGFGLPFVGGLLGGLLGAGLASRPFFGYPCPRPGYPCAGYPGYPPVGYPVPVGYPPIGYPGYGYRN
jgi:hypothetical protein